MNKVYIFDRNFNVSEEDYESDVEAMNRAKSISLRANFTILKNHNNKVFFFEHGEGCNARRKTELSATAYDIIVSKLEKDVSVARGKPHRKKG